ncbi:ATP-dependent Clp protease proteolytic subunit [Burkholderia arboris]|uniref:ATP-dependent Clp protease proteolytic subunit n=1 Tax=Burkholderia arboris TaxID=488730 RepID=UPI00158C9DCC
MKRQPGRKVAIRCPTPACCRIGRRPHHAARLATRDICLDEIVRMRERPNRLVVEATGQSMKSIAADTARDSGLSAEEGVKYRLANKIASSEPEIDKRAANR